MKHKGIQNVELVKGDIKNTLPKYIENRPEMRIALLHIDTDVYEPAKIGLSLLWDLIVPGGILVLDDYATVAGETFAIDDFFKDKQKEIFKFPFSHTKPSYMIKK